MSQPTEIKLDSRTLPEEGYDLEWQTYKEASTDNLIKGQYHKEEGIFFDPADGTVFESDWHVHQWRYTGDKPPEKNQIRALDRV